MGTPNYCIYQYKPIKLASKKNLRSSGFQGNEKEQQAIEEQEKQKETKIKRPTPALYTSIGGGVLGKVLGDNLISSVGTNYGNRLLSNKNIPIAKPPSLNKQYARTYKLIQHLGYKPYKAPSDFPGPLVFCKEPTGTDNEKWITLDLSKSWADPSVSTSYGARIANIALPDVSTISIGSGNTGRIGILAHELGHTTQSYTLRNFAGYGGRINKGALPYAILAGTLRSRNPKVQKIMDAAGLGIAAAGTLGGIAQLAGEIHASYRGHKIIRDSGILDNIPKGLRNTSKTSLHTVLGPYAGIPTYALCAAAPALGYYAARYLPEKIENLYKKLKNRKTQEAQVSKGE